MNSQTGSKVSKEHLCRNAYLYVRQSTLRQVVENTESTKRQYQLRRRAVALGWPEERIITIDSDLGRSGACAADREGFQRLVSEVGMGRAGIVLGLEVSRLARNSADWHRLLELCAHSGTLILDEDGVYDPTHFNDRLLLGLKGTMSEAELHIIRSRLRGGILSKAGRGELKIHLPIGFVYDLHDNVLLAPDLQIRETIDLFFTTFFRLGAAMATVRYLREKKILFPRRVNGGPRHGELIWGSLGLRRAVHLLHNPRYAGAYAYGRWRHRKHPDGRNTTETLPRDQWTVLIQDAHRGYISWAQFEEIQRTLAQTAKSYGLHRRHGPPREGSALLQGRIVCGLCGSRMSVRYHRRAAGPVPDYFCCNRGPTMTEPPCQVVPGAVVDAAVGRLIIESVTPAALEIAVAVQDELKKRFEEADRQHKRQIERAQYEADLSRQRFMKVDANNRLVAGTLEAEWNEKLLALEQTYQEYEARRQADQLVLDEAARRRIANLAVEFPALWNDTGTPVKERKRMLAYLIEDITLIKQERITAHVRFRGGETRTLDLAIPLNAWQKRSTNPAVVRLIDQLLEDNNDAQVAQILNDRGLTSGAEHEFTAQSIRWVRYNHGLKPLKLRLAHHGMVSTAELCGRLGVQRETVRNWRRAGYLNGRVCNGKGDWMYDVPEPDSLPTKTPSCTGNSTAPAKPSQLLQEV